MTISPFNHISFLEYVGEWRTICAYKINIFLSNAIASYEFPSDQQNYQDE